ncbi:unnamed protein product [Caenorhabditis auriculariae]|uniref:Uncharacterized protein n=1 Tax=Caenorhabditis auriculariae TaxID=2777116 RepID=A0A8S1GXZ0_9PELO|nr:unnamed protein product [Caenorhabditis auriculariae]
MAGSCVVSDHQMAAKDNRTDVEGRSQIRPPSVPAQVFVCGVVPGAGHSLFVRGEKRRLRLCVWIAARRPHGHLCHPVRLHFAPFLLVFMCFYKNSVLKRMFLRL